jgi:hypothetical protein
MMSNLAYNDAYAQMKIAELIQEAENNRLADLAAGPRRPVRARIAEWLVGIAERIDGRPQGSIARAEA